jgi:hypothetical protein
MAYHFPDESGSAKEREYLAQLKHRVLIQLGAIVRGQDAGEELRRIDTYLFSMFRPKPFHGRTGAEAKFIRQYEEVCAIVGQSTGRDPKKMTTREFFYTLAVMKQQAKKTKTTHGQPNQGKRSIPR